MRSEVQIFPDPPLCSACRVVPPGPETRVTECTGAIAQLGEHLLCKQGVVGSIPTGSTSLLRSPRHDPRPFVMGAGDGSANLPTLFFKNLDVVLT